MAKPPVREIDVAYKMKHQINRYIIDRNGCWIHKHKPGPDGYVRLIKTPETIGFAAHRLSYVLYKGDFDSQLYVCHGCDVRNCINPDHLFLGTAKDNTSDMYDKGRGYVERLSEDDIGFIVVLSEKGFSSRNIAELIGVDNTTVSAYLRKERSHG
jgi:hypothetical protein